MRLPGRITFTVLSCYYIESRIPCRILWNPDISGTSTRYSLSRNPRPSNSDRHSSWRMTMYISRAWNTSRLSALPECPAFNRDACQTCVQWNIFCQGDQLWLLNIVPNIWGSERWNEKWGRLHSRISYRYHIGEKLLLRIIPLSCLKCFTR